jgi:hypothetical protein
VSDFLQRGRREPISRVNLSLPEFLPLHRTPLLSPPPRVNLSLSTYEISKCVSRSFRLVQLEGVQSGGSGQRDDRRRRNDGSQAEGERRGGDRKRREVRHIVVHSAIEDQRNLDGNED